MDVLYFKRNCMFTYNYLFIHTYILSINTLVLKYLMPHGPIQDYCYIG